MTGRPAAFPFWLRSLMCLAASVCFFTFLYALAYKIRNDGFWLDGVIAAHVQPHVKPDRTELALRLTQIGSPIFIIPATFAAAMISAIVRRSLWTGIVVATTVGLVGLGSTAMKLGRTAMKEFINADPPQSLAEVRSFYEYSFPSGHVACALSLMGIVAIACGARPRHWFIWVGIAGVTAVVAATRIYLGVHWFSDTLGGVFLGCSAVFAGAALLPNRSVGAPSDRPRHRQAAEHP